MSNIKSKTSSRLLAAFLSLVMVLSMLPITSLTALAATTEHPNAVTITVKDEDGNPVKGASVAFVIDSVINGDAYKEDTKATDDNGVVEVMTSDDFVADDFKISASVTATGYTNGTLSTSAIATSTDNFDISVTSTTIKGVTIEAKNLTYNGELQELVSVTAIEGDTVNYQLDGEEKTSEVPMKKDAGTYNIKVTVSREGKDDLIENVVAKINLADIEGINIAPVTGLKYNEANQPLVTLTGDFAEGDIVTWEVNGTDTGSRDIPKRMAVDDYTVKLTVDRGLNYNKFEKTVIVGIALGEIDLGELEIKANELIYNTKDQEAVTITNQGDYSLLYQFAKNKEDLTDNGWTEITENEKPTVKDVGDYTLWIKAVKNENYNEKNTKAYPLNVTVAKASQTLEFTKGYVNGESTEVTLSGAVPFNEKFDFSAIDETQYINGAITYSVALSNEDDNITSIDENGCLTVGFAGSITVTATLSGDDKNYEKCTITHTLNVIGQVTEDGQWISFETKEIDYILGTSISNNNEIVISQQKADKENGIRGKVSYSIDIDNKYGVKIDNNGKVTVTSLEALAKKLQENNGTFDIVVTATKEQKTEKQWDWNSLSLKEVVVEEEDKATYSIHVSFETTPENSYTLSGKDGLNNWYISSVDVKPAEGYEIAKNAADVFADKVTFSDQGTDVRYVYLRNTTTGGITDKIEVNIKVDTKAPDTSKMSIDIQELTLVEKIGLKFGFYNPTVDIVFTVEDELDENESGLDHIVWFYTKDSNATSSILADKTGTLDVIKDNGKYVATLTVTATEAERFRGHIAFKAYDVANNESYAVKENNVVIVVDTINPTMSADFGLVDANGVYNLVVSEGATRHYYNGDVEFTFTVKEANFFSEDVVISVTKNGVAHTVNVAWFTDSENDEIHYGKFTLIGDGDYIVAMSYKDQTNNVMVDANGNEVALYTSEVITIDTTKPVVSIEYVHDSDVQKTIFTVTEHNFRASDIVITGMMQDINGVNVAFTADQLTEILNNAAWTQNGDVYTYEYDQYINGIYNLKVDYKDLSGWNAIQYVADEFVIDHEAPTEPVIEYIATPWNTFLNVITFGYYNPSVTI